MAHSSKIKKIIPKLRQPLGIEYIANNLLNVSEIEAKEILNDLIDDGVIVKIGNEYKVKGNKK